MKLKTKLCFVALSLAQSLSASPLTYLTNTIQVGDLPWGVAIYGTTAYVTNSGSSSISYFDIGNYTQGPIGTFSAGEPFYPTWIALSGSTAFFVSSESTLSYFDASTPQTQGIAPTILGTISLPSPLPIPGPVIFQAIPQGLDFFGGTCFVTAESIDSIGYFNLSNPGSVSYFPVGSGPWDVSIRGTTGFVCNRSSNNISLFDVTAPQAGVTGTINCFASPLNIGVYSGTTAVVSLWNDQNSGYVGFFDASNPLNTLTGTFSIGSTSLPTGAGISSGGTAFISDANTNTIRYFTVPFAGSAPLQNSLPTGIFPTLFSLYESGSNFTGFVANYLSSNVTAFFIPQIVVVNPPSGQTTAILNQGALTQTSVASTSNVDPSQVITVQAAAPATIITLAGLEAQGRVAYNVKVTATSDRAASFGDSSGNVTNVSFAVNGYLKAANNTTVGLARTNLTFDQSNFYGDGFDLFVQGDGKLFSSLNAQNGAVIGANDPSSINFARTVAVVQAAYNQDQASTLKASNVSFDDSAAVISGQVEAVESWTLQNGAYAYLSDGASVEADYTNFKGASSVNVTVAAGARYTTKLNDTGSDASDAAEVTALPGSDFSIAALSVIAKTTLVGEARIVNQFPNRPGDVTIAKSEPNLSLTMDTNSPGAVQMTILSPVAPTTLKQLTASKEGSNVIIGGNVNLTDFASDSVKTVLQYIDPPTELTDSNIDFAITDPKLVAQTANFGANSSVVFVIKNKSNGELSIPDLVANNLTANGTRLEVVVQDPPSSSIKKAILRANTLNGGFTISIQDPTGQSSVYRSGNIYYYQYGQVFAGFNKNAPGNLGIINGVLDEINGECNEGTQFLINNFENVEDPNPGPLVVAFKVIQFSQEKLDLLIHKELENELYSKNKESHLFVMGGYDHLSQDSNSLYNGYDVDSYYQLLGYKHHKSHANYLVMLGASESYMKVHPAKAHASYTTVWGSLGASGSHNRFSYGLDALFGYSFIDSTRHIILYDFYNQKAHSSHGAWNGSLDAKVNYAKKWSWTTFNFYENLGYIYGHENRYTEWGAYGANQKVKNENLSQLRNIVGVLLDLPKDPSLNFFADVSWVYEYYFTKNKYQAAFVDTDVYGTYSQRIPTRNYARFSGGLYGEKGHFTWRLAYTGLYGKAFSESSASIKLGYKF